MPSSPLDHLLQIWGFEYHLCMPSKSIKLALTCLGVQKHHLQPLTYFFDSSFSQVKPAADVPFLVVTSNDLVLPRGEAQTPWSGLQVLDESSAVSRELDLSYSPELGCP